MFDPTNPWPLLAAMAAAAIVAGAVFFWPGRFGPASLRSLVGVAIGFYAGLLVLVFWGMPLHFPPADDQDRFFLILLPAAIVAETIGMFAGRFRWCAWALRIIVAASAAPILLHGSAYLTQPAGPDSIGWTTSQTYLILGGLAVTLALVWTTINLLGKRTTGQATLLAVALACIGGEAAVMLSAYASGVAVPLLLGAALIGAALGSLRFSNSVDQRSASGLGVVALFAMIIAGRFFGELTTVNAALIFLAPLLCCLPELALRRLSPRWRGIMGVALTAMPVALALTLAYQKSHERSAGETSSDSQEPALEDLYRNLAK